MTKISVYSSRVQVLRPHHRSATSASHRLLYVETMSGVVFVCSFYTGYHTGHHALIPLQVPMIPLEHITMVQLYRTGPVVNRLHHSSFPPGCLWLKRLNSNTVSLSQSGHVCSCPVVLFGLLLLSAQFFTSGFRRLTRVASRVLVLAAFELGLCSGLG